MAKIMTNNELDNVLETELGSICSQSLYKDKGIKDLDISVTKNDGTLLIIECHYAPRTDMTFITTRYRRSDDTAREYMKVTGFYYGEPDLSATVDYMHNNYNMLYDIPECEEDKTNGNE